MLSVTSIRENQGEKISSGKSGYFVESQGKSGNFALTEVNQVSTMLFFPQTKCLPGFFRLATLREFFLSWLLGTLKYLLGASLQVSQLFLAKDLTN